MMYRTLEEEERSRAHLQAAGAAANSITVPMTGALAAEIKMLGAFIGSKTGAANRVDFAPGEAALDRAERRAEDAERARILALLETLRPMEAPYTRKEWAWEQRGERAMFEKIEAAIRCEQEGVCETAK